MVNDPVPANERLLTPSGTAGLAISVVLLLLIAAGSGLVSLRTQRATEAARMLQNERDAATDALLSLERAETGQRGFLLTGNEDYLTTYNRAVASAPGRLARLTQAAGANPAVDRLRTLADTKFAELGRTVDLAKAGRLEDALSVVKTDIGQTVMREYRQVTNGLLASETTRLTELLARVGRDTRMLVWLDGLAVVAVSAVAMQVLLGVRRAVALLRAVRRGLARANDELSRSNERLEQAVERRTAELTHANDEIQRFAYIVSHDLRSPLVNVMGFTSELETAQATLTSHMAALEVPEEVRQAVAEDMPEAIRFIRASTAKMDRLIQAILRLSREGRRRLTPEPVDMAGLMQTIADTTAHTAQAAGAIITVGEVPPLISDRLALEQVFANLVENALKYAKPDRPPRIELSGVQAGGRIRYAVKDNGRGIAERDLERVFDLFRRAGDQSVPGEGIGLAHVRALVRRLGGTITCASDLGVGTTFTVELPAKPTQHSDLAG